MQPKKQTFWRNFKPQLQLRIIPKRPEQHDHFQGSANTIPCSQKTDIFAKLLSTIAAADNSEDINQNDHFHCSTTTKPRSQKRKFWQNVKPQ